jgi:hypothetical protein
MSAKSFAEKSRPKDFANCKSASVVIVQVAFVHGGLAPIELPQNQDFPWKHRLNRLGTMPAKGMISDEGHGEKSMVAHAGQLFRTPIKSDLIYAIHARLGFDHRLATGSGFGLYDGRLHSHSFGCRHRHDSRAARPRQKTLTPRGKGRSCRR